MGRCQEKATPTGALQMARSSTISSRDPDSYQESVRGASINLIFACHGDFEGRFTWVKLPHLQLFHREENLPRIGYISLDPGLVFVSFPTRLNPAPIWGEVQLRKGNIVFHSHGERLHQRTLGSSYWASIGLSPEHLAQYGRALTELDLIPPTIGRVLRPDPCATTRLLRLHAEACRLAQREPAMIEHREVARAFDQDLLHALVNCLTIDAESSQPVAKRSHVNVMDRFEHILAAHSNRQVLIPELCAAMGVPERTLRMCCAAFLGMGPSQYDRLRRLNLVWRALRRADPATMSVAEVAKRYGFSEMGRFAAQYRMTFGENPSSTLRRALNP
jgi:AraC-like DNA-binding protein